jgi:ketosteroid isomerase-like protein
MWRRHPQGGRHVLLASAALALILVPGVAGAVAAAGGAADDDAQLIAAAKRTESGIVATWNDKKWDELSLLYAGDALVLAPNHEPVQGRGAIVEYFKSIRDVAGKIDLETKYIRVRGSGKFVSLTGYFTTQSGHVRMSYADLYERQPDGSVLLAVNDFGFREQAVG